MQRNPRSRWVLSAVIMVAATALGTRMPLHARADGDLMPLLRISGTPLSARTAVAELPVPRGWRSDLVEALVQGAVQTQGKRLQGQTVSRWDDGSARRLLLRWTGELPEELGSDWRILTQQDAAAGWSYDYRLVAASADTVPWLTALRDVPLEQTQYEMYELVLAHQGHEVGLRLGLRRDGRLYWWQFVRADFLQRGPVFDVLRAGGPVYNEETTLQADLYLILYSNGVIEAYAHFTSHQREGEPTGMHGIPVLAFNPPQAERLDHVLRGDRSRFDLGAVQLDLGPARAYADSVFPGSLRTEAGTIVWQPWQDQQIWGELLVDDAGTPEHRIIRRAGTGSSLTSQHRSAADRYWVTRAGDQFIPRGMARSVRFALSLGDTPPVMARYEAPAWWHGYAGNLPIYGQLPVLWWALPEAMDTGVQTYLEPHPRGGYPFEVGRRSRGNDGTLSVAMLLLCRAGGDESLCAAALQSAYWWADIAIDHTSYTVHELPKYSWQWIVQPYHRWLEPVHAYHRTSDPYLLETARYAADAYYRFFWTNRPHRSVGRDALPVADLLALYETTGETVYLQRSREILAEVRRSYNQTEHYWPGHQSGCGPNGIARQPDWEYIPMVLARLHLQLLQTAGSSLPPDETVASWQFMRFMAELVQDRGGEGWVTHGVAMSYMVLAALADRFPAEAARWLDMLDQRNHQNGMPASHDGGRPYNWVVAALWFDSRAWNASWDDGTLHLDPHPRLLGLRGAPQQATVLSPAGPVPMRWRHGHLQASPPAGVRVVHQAIER